MRLKKDIVDHLWGIFSGTKKTRKVCGGLERESNSTPPIRFTKEIRGNKTCAKTGGEGREKLSWWVSDNATVTDKRPNL